MIERFYLLWSHRLLLNNFNGSHHAGVSGDALTDLTVGALGDNFTYLVVVLELANVLLDKVLLSNLNLG
jgi:hypothetical protein